MFNNIPISLGFDDVAIRQNKNICKSRLDALINSEIIRGVFRPVPLIAANMSSVVDSNFIIKLYRLGAFGIMHRAANDEHLLDEVRKIRRKCAFVAASIGIKETDYELAKSLINSGVNIINIDIAHGYSDLVFDMAKKIKKYHPKIKIIIGNTTNPKIIKECHKIVDAIKIGIGQGSACETKDTAGCTEKMFSTILNFKKISKRYGIPIISDGGVRKPSDFVKAIAAGANSVMMGSVFCKCPESAGEIVYVDDKKRKVYSGMASRRVQESWRGGLKSGTCPEGKTIYLDIGESVSKLIERYSGALKSGITYAGGNSIPTFQRKVRFVRFQ